MPIVSIADCTALKASLDAMDAARESHRRHVERHGTQRRAPGLLSKGVALLRRLAADKRSAASERPLKNPAEAIG